MSNPALFVGVLVPPEAASELVDIVRQGRRGRSGPLAACTANVIAGIEQMAAAVAAREVVSPDNPPAASGLSSRNVEGMEAETEITVAAAAARLGRSRQAVLRRIARGTLPARRDERGHYLIHRANLTTKGTTK